MDNLSHDIERYLSGELTPAEMHELEKKALNDPFLAEALEGASSISSNEFKRDLQALRRQLHTNTKRNGGMKLSWNYPLRIAAVFLLIAISAHIVVLLTQAPKSDEGNLAFKDSRQPRLHDSVKTEPPSEILEEKSDAAESVQGTKEDIPSPEVQSTRREAGPGPGEEAALEDEIPTEKIESKPAETENVPQSADEFLSLDQQTDNEIQSAREQQVSTPMSGKIREEIAKSAPAKKQESKVVTGQVVDFEDGTPIPGVNVSVKGTSIGTVTDIEGSYKITLPDPTQSLVFSFTGFSDQEIPVPEDQILNVQLSSDVSQLSEVVVEGYMEGKKLEGVTWDLARPAGGYKAYYQYLERNLTYPPQALDNRIEGKVTVRFAVDTTGQLSDFRVVRSLGYGCDEEVIRLVKEGPAWSPTKRNNEPVIGRVKVKVKFRLPG